MLGAILKGVKVGVCIVAAIDTTMIGIAGTNYALKLIKAAKKAKNSQWEETKKPFKDHEWFNKFMEALNE